MAGRDLSSTPIDQLRIATLDPQDRIAKHFRLYELTISETADRAPHLFEGYDLRDSADAYLRSIDAFLKEHQRR